MKSIDSLRPGAFIPNVLLVDDEPDVTAAMVTAMRKEPFVIYTANSASDGMKVLAQTNIDVIISDERMPGMSGSRFLSLVHEQYPETIRIILSGQADIKATLDAINNAHVHRFLLKPTSSQEVASCIRQSVTAREQMRTRDAQNHRPGEMTIVDHSEKFNRAIDSLWIAFQPIVRASDWRVFGYEALVRSRHEELNTPQLLFDAADELQRVIELERNVRRMVAARISSLSTELRILVNVHPKTLLDDELYAADSPLLQLNSRITLEITERDNLHDIPDVATRLESLRRLGYQLALDDMGAGYAGLTSFALISPDIVKFDRELIREIHESPTKARLVSSFIALCKEMHILTIAEGIETAEEYLEVKRLGCDLLQGYFIAPPAEPFLSPSARS